MYHSFIALLYFEIKSYLKNKIAVFWTFAYPIIMAVFLIAVFNQPQSVNHFTELYAFQTLIGVISITIMVTALFGTGQALADMRTDKSLCTYMYIGLSIRQVFLAILLSRMMIVFVFSLFFVMIGVLILHIDVAWNAYVVLRFVSAIIVACTFCFTLVLPMMYLANNSTALIALTNIVNLYAILSSSIFIPKFTMPVWSHIIVDTSPFYYLNIMIRNAFVTSSYLWSILLGLCILSAILFYTFSNRKLMLN